jgi:hypothetical protein
MHGEELKSDKGWQIPGSSCVMNTLRQRVQFVDMYMAERPPALDTRRL